MVNANFSTGVLSAKIGDTSTDAKIGLGTIVTGKNGTEFIYVQFDGAVTGPGYVVVIDEANQASMLSTSNDARGDRLGVAVVGGADNDYAYVQTKGPAQIQVAASCAANARLNATATAGQIDDDGTSTTYSLEGIVLTTARAASAGLAPGMLNYPLVGAVI